MTNDSIGMSNEDRHIPSRATKSLISGRHKPEGMTKSKKPVVDTSAFPEQDVRENTLKKSGLLVKTDDPRFNTGKTKENKLEKPIVCDCVMPAHTNKEGVADKVIWIERRVMNNKFKTPYIRIPSFIPMDTLNELVYDGGKIDPETKKKIGTKLVTMYHGSKKCVGTRQIEAFMKCASINNEVKEYVAN